MSNSSGLQMIEFGEKIEDQRETYRANSAYKRENYKTTFTLNPHKFLESNQV